MSKRWAIALALLTLVLVRAAGWFFTRAQAPIPAPSGAVEPVQETQAPFRKETSIPENAPRPRLSPPAPGQDEAELPARAQNEIASCLGSAGANVRSLGELVRKVLPSDPSQGERFRKYRNVHVTLPNGEKRRFHLYADSTPDGKPLTRLRVFTEDAEGLPLPTSIPPEHQVNPDEALVREYLAGGTVEFVEEAWNWRGQSENGTAQSLDWTEENGRVIEAQVVTGETSLGCAILNQPDCECRE